MIDIKIKHVFIGIIFAFIFYAFSINYQLIISNIKLVYKPILYYRYNLGEFDAKNIDSNRFMIKIGQNRFSENDIVLSLPAIRLIPSTESEFDTLADLEIKDWGRIIGKR